MKTKITILIAAAASTLLADDIKTLSGTTYKGITITRIEPNGIAISHEEGQAKIPFADLSEDLRTKYHYDPQKAAVFTEAERKVAAQRNAADMVRRAAEERAQEQERQNRFSGGNQQQLQQPAPANPATEQQTLTLEQMEQVVELWTKLLQMQSAQDQLNNAQTQQNNAQTQQFFDTLQQLQAIKRGRSRAQIKQTPEQANAWWQQYQQQQKLEQMQFEIEKLRQQRR